MNMTPLLRQLSKEDFNKMLAASTLREGFLMEIALVDPSFEYHIDLPPKSSSQGKVNSAQQEGLADMAAWLADEKRFPDG